MPFRVRHVLATTALLAACGGRYSHIDGESGGGSSGTSNGNGGSTGSGGSGQGGTKAGGKAGNSSSGGSTSVGGKSTGTAGTSSCACPDIDLDCPPGYVKQLDPTGCCEECVPLDCRMVGCPGIACGSGSQLYYPPDQCCPVCGPSSCDAQRKDYFAFKEQLLSKYNSLGCMSDADCGLLWDSNACSSSGCGGSPFPLFYEKEIRLSLDAYAKACTGCPPLPVPPCEPSLPPACVQGRCETRPFR